MCYTGAWIVTGGMHAGVMKHVGEAVREFTVAEGSKSKIVALGIVPWGAVNNKESLVEESLQVRRHTMSIEYTTLQLIVHVQ